MTDGPGRVTAGRAAAGVRDVSAGAGGGETDGGGTVGTGAAVAGARGGALAAASAVVCTVCDRASMRRRSGAAGTPSVPRAWRRPRGSAPAVPGHGTRQQRRCARLPLGCTARWAPVAGTKAARGARLAGGTWWRPGHRCQRGRRSAPCPTARAACSRPHGDRTAPLPDLVGARDAEIDELDAPLRRDHHVAGLHVAKDHRRRAGVKIAAHLHLHGPVEHLPPSIGARRAPDASRGLPWMNSITR